MKNFFKNKNMLIGVLLTIVFVMAIGFAGFAQNLQISDTASSTNTWNVYISNAELISNSPKATGSVTKAEGLEATFVTTLHSPGDSVVYNVTVKNDGNVDATLDELNLNTANNDSVIKYSYSGIAKGDTLAQSESKTFRVTVEYDSTKTGTASETKKSNSATLELNFIQKTESSESSNVVYRWSTDELYIGDSIEAIEITTDPSTLGKNYYLKHEIDSNNLITALYVCFVTDAEYCMQGGNPSYHENNVAILRANETWFNNVGGSCTFGNSNSYCNSSFFTSVNAYSNGGVGVRASDGYCGSNSGGYSYCA